MGRDNETDTEFLERTNREKNQETMEFMDNFAEAYRTDDESCIDRGKRLIMNYENGTAEEKAVMDDLMITLCGYSMPTLMKERI